MADSVFRERPSFVRSAASAAADPMQAVEEVTSRISRAEGCFALAFVSGGRDIETIARALDEKLGGMPVFGCTSAGQITGVGYGTEGLLLLVFPKQHFRCASVLIEPLTDVTNTSIAAEVQRKSGKFRRTAGWNRLGLVFADGLSKQEDHLVATLEAVLGDLPVFGGSAGDALQFEEAFVLHGGEAHRNAAVLLLLETDLAFTGIGFDHFLPAETQIVITDADPDARKVFEINGAPAAVEYARLVVSLPL